jgi:hypothetical protein
MSLWCRIITSYRTFFLYASSAQEAEDWIKILRWRLVHWLLEERYAFLASETSSYNFRTFHAYLESRVTLRYLAVVHNTEKFWIPKTTWDRFAYQWLSFSLPPFLSHHSAWLACETSVFFYDIVVFHVPICFTLAFASSSMHSFLAVTLIFSCTLLEHATFVLRSYRSYVPIWYIPLLLYNQ